MRILFIGFALLVACDASSSSDAGGAGGNTASSTSATPAGPSATSGTTTGTTSGAPTCADAGCNVNATCALAGGVAACTCKPGYVGDGKTCTLEPLPAGVGFTRVAGTPFTAACEPSESAFGFGADCRAIFLAWSGGVGDTARNRLVVTGGGHNDYYGNELYAFDLAAMGWVRLNEPTPLDTHTDCIETLPDGRPTSRHTYGGLVYATGRDQMLLFGGVASCEAGGFVDDVWELDFAGLDAEPATGAYWQQTVPTVEGLPYGGILAASDWDETSGLAYVYVASGPLVTYDPTTDTASIVSEPNLGGYHWTAEVEPQARKLFLAGEGRLVTIDLDGAHAVNDLTSTLSACAPLAGVAYPGLAYDEKRGRIVGWAGGETVYTIDLATSTCTVRTFIENAPGPQIENGTNGRFRYFPDVDVFVLANDPEDDVYLLRLE